MTDETIPVKQTREDHFDDVVRRMCPGGFVPLRSPESWCDQLESATGERPSPEEAVASVKRVGGVWAKVREPKPVPEPSSKPDDGTRVTHFGPSPDDPPAS